MTLDVVDIVGFLPANEQAIWQLDARHQCPRYSPGYALLDAALAIAEQASSELGEKLAGLTDSEITTPAQTKRILQWLAQRGCTLPNIQKQTVLDALKRSDLTAPAKQLLTLRLDGAHAAVDKLATLRQWIDSDQRIRYVYRYHGAMPGRFTSLGAQVQNMKKPETDDVTAAIEAVRTGDLAHMQARYERPLAVVGDITRALVTPAPGHRLFIADLSGIKSRGLAWLCNETDKLEQWREFDRTGNPAFEPYYRFGLEELKLDPKLARKSARPPIWPTAIKALSVPGVGWHRRTMPAPIRKFTVVGKLGFAGIPTSPSSGRWRCARRQTRSNIPASCSPLRASHSNTKTVFCSCCCRPGDASHIRLPGSMPMKTAAASPFAMPAADAGSGTTFSNAKAHSAG